MSLGMQIVDLLRGEGDKNFILTDDLLDMGKLLENLKTIVTHNYPFQDLTSSLKNIFDRKIIIIERAYFDSVNKML